MEITDDLKIKLLHDLNTAVYHLETVLKFVKTEVKDEDILLLQSSALEKIKKTVDQIKALQILQKSEV